MLVLGSHGYETAVKGKNGFVCFVQRSWAAGFDAPEFWNPKIRGPNCFNPPAARSELLQELKRTEWVLAGATRQAAVASHDFKAPEAGALSFMLSKNGYLSDDAAGPWLPALERRGRLQRTRVAAACMTAMHVCKRPVAALSSASWR